jgi:hypothetical protein
MASVAGADAQAGTLPTRGLDDPQRCHVLEQQHDDTEGGGLGDCTHIRHQPRAGRVDRDGDDRSPAKIDIDPPRH